MQNTKFWLQFSVVNLFLVASIGVLMRYKIGFEFPYFNQDGLHHSHSHFAFSGWISHTLMVLMIHFLEKRANDFVDFLKYKRILIANLICAYAMLISFAIQSYGAVSITFSTLSIFVSYYFAYHYIKDLKRVNGALLSKKWFQAALFFNVLSSLGTFALAYMMATKNIPQNIYLSSIFFYLHFQYNGWFFFVCMGLLYDFLNLNQSKNKNWDTIFKLFFVSCIPAYFLSTLWLGLPILLYVLTAIGAVFQVYAWYLFLRVLKKEKVQNLQTIPAMFKRAFMLIAFALTIKLLLQLASTVPEISELAFGLKTIVVAYLHLVLLVIISLFLIIYIYSNAFFEVTKKIKIGFVIFAIGVLANEIALGLQGVFSINYILIPKINEILFLISVFILLGLGVLTFNTIKKQK